MSPKESIYPDIEDSNQNRKFPEVENTKGRQKIQSQKIDGRAGITQEASEPGALSAISFARD